MGHRSGCPEVPVGFRVLGVWDPLGASIGSPLWCPEVPVGVRVLGVRSRLRASIGSPLWCPEVPVGFRVMGVGSPLRASIGSPPWCPEVPVGFRVWCVWSPLRAFVGSPPWCSEVPVGLWVFGVLDSFGHAFRVLGVLGFVRPFVCVRLPVRPSRPFYQSVRPSVRAESSVFWAEESLSSFGRTSSACRRASRGPFRMLTLRCPEVRLEF